LDQLDTKLPLINRQLLICVDLSIRLKFKVQIVTEMR
jgi:hypothetical protein